MLSSVLDVAVGSASDGLLGYAVKIRNQIRFTPLIAFPAPSVVHIKARILPRLITGTAFLSGSAVHKKGGFYHQIVMIAL